MNCPDEQRTVPENRDKTPGRDSHARIRNRDICPVPVPSRFASADVPVGVPTVSFLEQAERLLETEALTPWQRGFVVGCRRHVDAGRELSEKQVATLRRLLDIASDSETLAPARAFAQPDGDR